MSQSAAAARLELEEPHKEDPADYPPLAPAARERLHARLAASLADPRPSLPDEYIDEHGVTRIRGIDD